MDRMIPALVPRDCVKSLRSSYKGVYRMTGVALHGVVSQVRGSPMKAYNLRLTSDDGGRKAQLQKVVAI